MKLLKQINRWFDLNLGWFFINGMKTKHWNNYLKRKYKNERDNDQGIQRQ